MKVGKVVRLYMYFLLELVFFQLNTIKLIIFKYIFPKYLSKKKY